MRLELNAKPEASFLDFLCEGLALLPGDIYERGGPMDYSALFQIASLAMPHLRFVLDAAGPHVWPTRTPISSR